jgi:hypothetical protein
MEGRKRKEEKKKRRKAITKQPMGAHVRTTVRKAHKTHKDRVIRKEIVWTPTLTEAAAGV